jgi:hypothetical protein
MIATTTDYSRPVDEEQILAYHFDENLKRLIGDRVVFEEEESHFAPEPSVCCRIRNDQGVEFTLVHLQSSKVLMVLGEAGVDRAMSARVFASEFRELEAYRMGRPDEPNDSRGVTDSPDS